MKKTLKRIISCTAALAVMTTGMLTTFSTPALASEDETIIDELTQFGYKPFDDGGLMDNDRLGREYQMYYKVNNSKVWFMQAFREYNRFEFVLTDDVKYEDIKDRVAEILEEYYPDNNLNDTPDMIGQPDYHPCPNIRIETVLGKTRYAVSFGSLSLKADDEAVLREKGVSKEIMQKLKEENLISAFYDIGENYAVVQYDPIKYMTYSGDLDPEAIEKYISENGLKCKMADISEDESCIRYRLVPDDGVDFEEYLSYWVELYKEFGIRQAFSTVDLDLEMSGKNALLEEPAVTTTAPVTTAPDAVTSTTVVTTITEPEQPEEYTVRDCAFIAAKIAQGKTDELPGTADFNGDGKVNIRDAAAIAHSLAVKKN